MIPVPEASTGSGAGTQTVSGSARRHYEPLAPNGQRLGRLCRYRQDLVRESESNAKCGGDFVKCGDRIAAAGQVSEIRGGFQRVIWGQPVAKLSLTDCRPEITKAQAGKWMGESRLEGALRDLFRSRPSGAGFDPRPYPSWHKAALHWAWAHEGESLPPWRSIDSGHGRSRDSPRSAAKSCEQFKQTTMQL